jgi:hypothetical protein
LRKAVVLALLLVGGRAWGADLLETFGYVIPTGTSALATAVNSTAMAWDEPSTKAWKWIGWGSAAADAVTGAVIIAAGKNNTDTWVLSGLAFGLGAAAATTAWLVNDEPTQPESRKVTWAPVVGKGGVGIVIGGKF